jgi:hypothetical protein
MNMKKLSLLTIIFTLSVAYAFAQVPQPAPENLNWVPIDQPTGIRADPETYLQGTYIEVGVAQAGSCGTFGPTPAGYHPYYPGLGFVADYDVNGFAVGTPPYSGDYFVPGTPEERWVLEWTAGGFERTFNNASLMGDEDVPQTSLTNTSAGTTNSCIWTGTATFGAESVLVRQEIVFDDVNLYFIFRMTLTNTGTVPLTSVEYMRNVDPDQGLDVGCGFPTINYVAHQPGSPGSGDTALVIAHTSGCNSIPLGLYTVHPNAVVSTEGFTNTDPDWILDSPVEYSEGAPNFADEAIALAFRFDALNPGQSINFQYAYILNEAALIEPPPLDTVPVSNWALALMIGLIVIFTIIRFKRMN